MMAALPHSVWQHRKDKVNGERKEVTEWHRIAADNRLATVSLTLKDWSR